MHQLYLKRFIIVGVVYFFSNPLFIMGQKVDLMSLSNNNNAIKRTIDNETNISTDSLIRLLANWSRFPTSYKTDQNYIFNFPDPFFGNVPMRLYIPKTYRADKKTPLILILHGAVQLSSFARLEPLNNSQQIRNESDDDDIFFDYFKKQNYIILRPVADPAKKFNWVINSFNDPLHSGPSSPENVNLTFSCIVNAIIKLKRNLNIDDSRVFAFGHSDGADGAFGMEMFQPNLFAGFLIYNSMLTVLRANNIYLHNAQNSSSYIVHSDLDDLRPIQQTKAIVAILKELNAKVVFKEYDGYKHFDNHLKIDLPFANKFILNTIRNPIPPNIYWESNNHVDNQCFWLRVDSFDLSLPKKNWQTESNLDLYNKIDKIWMKFKYYDNGPGYAIKASYRENTFKIDCSRVEAFHILISNEMVDLQKPIKVYANGRLVFEKIVKPNREFIESTFEKYFDRDCIWINSLKIDVSN